MKVIIIMSDYVDILRAARSGQIETSDQQTRRFVWLTALSVLSIFVASLIFWPAGRPTFHFEEGGAVTGIVTVMLAMSAGFAFIMYLLRIHEKFRVQATWLLATAGFIFLALDEQIELHERIGGIIDESIQITSLGLPFANDLIVIGYGIAVIPVLIYALPELLKWRGVLEILTIAALFFVIHTVIDTLYLESNPLWYIAEETAKLICVTFIFVAMLSVVMAGVRNICRFE